MSPANLTQNQLRVVICLVLALVTAALYWPVTHHEFVNLDDESYITANPRVVGGLTGSGIAWAFQSGYAANWHPLTWISHMLDCQWYGVSPAGHHLTSLLLHIANTLLLFLLLNQLTAAPWRSAMVAALFAWHPVHVESVAWAAERKDVLSAFFWMLTLIAYTRYVTGGKCQATRTNSIRSRVTCLPAEAPPGGTKAGHPSLYYFLALFFFACGLMSKPMVVTLPFVLLLLDYWPLERVTSDMWRVTRFRIPVPQLSVLNQLLLEKLPFFTLAAAGGVVTYLAQKSGGAFWSSGLPLPSRIANALVSYLRYISNTFWPADLAVVYPHPLHWPTALVIGAGLVLAFWTGLFLRRARQNPHLIVGWLWFLGTLIPVTGIVQVGPQSMADRYLYLPGIGLFILVVWGLAELVDFRPRWRPVMALAGIAALAACLVSARIQLAVWQNSLTLLRHAIVVTTDNYIACNSLGRALDQAGKPEESLPWYEESVRIEPRYPQAQFNLGQAWLNRGKPDKACEHLAIAVKLVPDNAGARYYLGTALLNAGQWDEAIIQFTEELRLTPNEAAAHCQLARALQRRNQWADAIGHYRETLRLATEFPGAKNELETILAAHPELR